MDDSNHAAAALSGFGLRDKEAGLYLACLKNGRLTVQQAARYAGLKRTTVYPIIDELDRQGVIKREVVSGRVFLEAAPPETLLLRLSERQEGLARALPGLQALRHRPSAAPAVRYFRGREGFKKFFRELLDSGVSEWLIITSGKEFLSFVSERYIIDHLIREKRQRRIRSRQIITDSRYAREIVAKDRLENRESRLIDGARRLPVIEIVFGDAVAIISSNFSDLIMLIESKDVAETHRTYFELLWQAGREAGG